ncbi:sialate O-acetylesterase [bacterium]|nr:sialate O-acetylesterase [bacterium]
MRKTGTAGLVLSLIFIMAIPASADIRLPKLVSDGMVLQRDAPVRIWGWAAEGEKITVHFMNSACPATADAGGEWEVMLPPMDAGGPYNMRIEAGNSITIHDIVIGDVWVCSGQSNMQMALGWLGIYQDEIDHSENPLIRQFLVPWEANFNGRAEDVKSGAWQSANPENVRRFTAVGYFFAKKLYEAYHVPVGLINASLGGSSAEAWISEESIQSFPDYYETAQRFKKPGTLDRINRLDNERIREWFRNLNGSDEGYRDPSGSWRNSGHDTSGWKTMPLPGYWADTELGPVNGAVWFRKTIWVPPGMAGKPAVLRLGRIVDSDSVFINGCFAGATGSQYAQRTYPLSGDLLKAGENTIVIRVINQRRHGGFVPGKTYELLYRETRIDLTGDWRYRPGAFAEPLEDGLFTGKIPTGLFNGMLAPLLNFRIRGVIWYQGESNTSRAFEHYDLFKLLIGDWRKNWGQGDFPFLFVQLPNFVEVNNQTTCYDWAIFRESQLKALCIPNTGMAVTIDIGEYNDIHPVNKRDVGYRLALAAQKAAYGEKHIVCPGPLYRSMKIVDHKIILAFSNTGSGLAVQNGGTPDGFEICGKDNQFFPAKTEIRKNQVVLWSDRVADPVAARYAWANNPQGANLINQEGLPASPFRTSPLY